MLQHRVASEGGVRALNTSSVRLCEKRNDVTSSNQVDKINANKEVDQTESATVVEQKAEDDSKVKIVAKEIEEPVTVKTDDGSAKPLKAAPEQVKTDAPKTGKESLLDLLGAMKVEVTNKKKLKHLKLKQSYEPTPTSKPAALESTISMFQQATVEASSQR